MPVRPLQQLILATLCAVLFTGCAQTRQIVQNPFTYGARQRATQFNIAQVAEREGHLRQSAEQYRALMEKDAKDARYPHRLGVVQLRLGEFEEGIALLEKASKMKPNDPQILNDLGFAYLERGDCEDAEELFKQTLSLNPSDKRAVNNLGLCAGYAGRYDEAFKYFRRAGTEAEAHANLAYVMAQRGELERAMERYNRALSSDPNLQPAAEALVQLTGLTHEMQEEAANVKLAEFQGGIEAAPVEPAVATEDFPPAPELGLSAP